MQRALLCAAAISQILVSGGPTSAVSAGSPVPLRNAGFESPGLHEAWTVHVYGEQPRVSLDRTVFREGQQALRVSAEKPSDTAFGQELQLQPGRWYRLAGWVRTENLDPHGAPVCGTFQIQAPGGHAVLATGRNHSGTCDWTRETICFTPPGDGLTRIAIFFVGYGKGIGTAWFDGLTLEETNTAVSTLQITRTPLCPGTISPLQYGQFIEYLCGLTLSMSAEQVYDASFEGVPPYGFVFRKAAQVPLFDAEAWPGPRNSLTLPGLRHRIPHDGSSEGTHDANGSYGWSLQVRVL